MGKNFTELARAMGSTLKQSILWQSSDLSSGVSWDLAFAWLADEPHAHHPAMPLSLMAAMVVLALQGGWPY
jgi:hypothetical protein